jgi:hypothetical protein
MVKNEESVTKYTEINKNKFYKKNNTWTYELKLSDFELGKLLESRQQSSTEKCWITITAAHAKSYETKISKTKEIDYETFDYYLELPPKSPIENFKTDLVIENPGELKCSWTRGTTLDNCDADSLDGYCIELEHRPEGAGEFVSVNGLSWNQDILGTTGVYKLIRTEVPEVEVEEEEGVLSLIGQGTTTEVYIEDPNCTSFYFTPKTLGILPGDEYRFIIYPYSHYQSEHTLIAPQGTVSDGKVSKGIVRVKVSEGWAEGQVWVMTSKGWIRAEAVYAKDTDGWKESK